MDIVTFHRDMFDIGNTFLTNFTTSIFYNICMNTNKTKPLRIDLLELIREASLNTQATVITYLFSKLITTNVFTNLIAGFSFPYMKYGILYGLRYGIVNGVWSLMYRRCVGLLWGLLVN